MTDAYDVRMRHNAAGESDDWATLVKTHRALRGATQGGLAELAKVSRETVWRWENGRQVPEDADTVDLVVKALPTLDRDTAFRAAGLLPSAAVTADPYAYVRAMGLDPNGRVVRVILSLDISEGLRMDALRREREMQLRDEQRRLDDLKWTIEQQRKREQEEPGEQAAS